MKVLLVSTNSDEAGAPRHVETVANGLRSDVVFEMVFGERGPVSERMFNNGFTVHVIPELRNNISPFLDIVAFKKLLTITKKFNPDLIHCHSAKAGMISRIVCIFTGTKWIYTVHGWGWRGFSSLKASLVIFIERLLSKVPSGKYIFVSNSVSRDAKEILNLNHSKGCVIYNGVPRVPSCSLIHRSNFTILMPARVCDAKDHSSLISAFELCFRPSDRLILCGSGTDSADFISRVKDLATNSFKNIEFLGERSDMPSLYANCDVVALISNFEALPLTLIEAMSCNKPIIATNVGGIPEVISNSYDGLLVKPKDINSIVRSIDILRNPTVAALYSSRAHDKYEKKFTDIAMLTSVFDVYQSV